MAQIIKTWPAFFHPREVNHIFENVAEWDKFVFTLGRGITMAEAERAIAILEGASGNTAV